MAKDDMDNNQTGNGRNQYEISAWLLVGITYQNRMGVGPVKKNHIGDVVDKIHKPK